MRLLITGSQGFIGKNFIAQVRASALEASKDTPGHTLLEVYPFDKEDSLELLESYCEKCDFVFHFAGVNRPKNEAEFREGNADFSQTLLDTLAKTGRRIPVLLTSSIQATLANPYGESKKAAEEVFFEYARKTDAPVFVYRLPNVFGKWSRPNYNSAVATFCHNIARGLPIRVDDPEKEITLVYIDDVVKQFLSVLTEPPQSLGEYYEISETTTITLSALVELLEQFRDSRQTFDVPRQQDSFSRKLYATYLSFLPQDSFSYLLNHHKDERGSFYEFMHLGSSGQMSVNTTQPGLTKGNHWHQTKNEKFLVVSGDALIRLRAIDSTGVVEYRVSGTEPCVVDIPPGYTHSISNCGTGELITVIWANEVYDPSSPDTYYEEV